jgi:hypothetical protein
MDDTSFPSAKQARDMTVRAKIQNDGMDVLVAKCKIQIRECANRVNYRDALREHSLYHMAEQIAHETAIFLWSEGYGAHVSTGELDGEMFSLFISWEKK